MNTQLIATGGQVIIKPTPVPDSVNGILIPEEFKKSPNSGVIQSIDPASQLKPGEEVCFNYRQGYEVEFTGTTYLSINEEYILATKNNNNMQPLHDRVLIKPIKKGQSKSKGGLVLLEDQNIAEGLVLKTGRGKKDEPMLLTEGDVVIFPKSSGIPFGEEIVIVQSEIIAIINENED